MLVLEINTYPLIYHLYSSFVVIFFQYKIYSRITDCIALSGVSSWVCGHRVRARSYAR